MTNVTNMEPTLHQNRDFCEIEIVMIFETQKRRTIFLENEDLWRHSVDLGPILEPLDFEGAPKITPFGNKSI
jgi:hypothetical protein